MSHCATGCTAEIVIRQSNKLLLVTTERIATVSFCNVKSTFDARLEEQMSTDTGTIKLEKVPKKARKKFKGIEWFLSKKQLNSMEFFACKADLRRHLTDL